MELLTGLFSGWGAVLVGVVMALTTLLNWPKWLNYVWALVVLLSGVLAL